MALNGLYCDDVPLSNYSLTHAVWLAAVPTKQQFWRSIERRVIDASTDTTTCLRFEGRHFEHTV